MDKHFPSKLWDELIEQEGLTLNLLIRKRINLKLFMYAHLEGDFIVTQPLLPFLEQNL